MGGALGAGRERLLLAALPRLLGGRAALGGVSSELAGTALGGCAGADCAPAAPLAAARWVELTLLELTLLELTRLELTLLELGESAAAVNAGRLRAELWGFLLLGGRWVAAPRLLDAGSVIAARLLGDF